MAPTASPAISSATASIAAVIHGNKSQNARQKALNGFRDGSVSILVATDIAARGIDVPGISHVINFDLPDEAGKLCPPHRPHRPQRRGRHCDHALRSGRRPKLRAVERIIRMKLPILADYLAEADPKPIPGEVNRIERYVDPRAKANPRSRNQRPGLSAGKSKGARRPGQGAGQGAAKGHGAAVDAALADLPPRRNSAGPGMRRKAETDRDARIATEAPQPHHKPNAERNRHMPEQAEGKPAFKKKRRFGGKPGGQRAA